MSKQVILTEEGLRNLESELENLLHFRLVTFLKTVNTTKRKTSKQSSKQGFWK